jgi:type IV pilus assembly protein PilY1
MHLKKVFSLVQIVCIIFFNVSHIRIVHADDMDIFVNYVQPNVDLLISSSSAMAGDILSEPYVAGTTYSTPLTYTTGAVYKWLNSTPGCKPQPKPCYTAYAASVGEVTDTTAQTALNLVGYWTGSIGGSAVSLFKGNYLNYSICTPPACGTLQSKISIANTALTNLINNTQGIRFGASKYGAGGGLMLEPIRDMTAANKATLINSITTMGLDGAGNPLGAQMKHAGDYFEGHLAGYDSPTLYACQPSFAILITDGKATSTDPVIEATKLFTLDHSSTFAGTQNVIVHVIAFALPQADIDAGAVQELKNVAIAGGGSYFEAQNSAQLEKALQNAIGQILAATFSFATPVVPTTGTSGSTRAYLASFQSNPSRPFWRGFLKAYTRDSNGLIQVDADGIPLASSIAWDAGQVLSTTAANSRTIYTPISGALQSFTTSNSSITMGLMGASSDAEKDDIINFTRGIDTYDEDFDLNITEQRQWKLGDIFHSTPVLVTPPFLANSEASYVAFKTANASRTSVLLAGANDGMIHSFRENSGAEIWAFVPPDQLSNVGRR